MALTTVTQYPHGWLPYGSDDDSVVVQHPLTSEPSAADLGFSTRSTGAGTPANIVYDSVKGMQPNSAGYRYQTFSAGNGALDGGFQISLEVEKAFVCAEDADNGSSGVDGLDEAPLGFLPGAYTSNQYWIFHRTGDALAGRQFNVTNLNNNYYTDTSGTLKVHSIGKDEFVTLNFGYIPGPNGGEVIMAVDGLIVLRESTGDSAVTDIITNLYVGCASAGAKPMGAYYIRNLQIAARPPSFSVHPKLRKVVYWGDSQVKDLEHTGGPDYDNRAGLVFMKELQKLGLYCGEFVCHSNSGYTFQDSGANDLSGTMATQLAAEKPTLILIRAGTNDVNSGSYDASTFETEIAGYIDTMLAYSSNVEIVLAGVPSLSYDSTYTATHKLNRTAIDGFYKSIASTRARVHYIDTYNYLGGENPDANMFIGQQDGLSDNLHFAARGSMLQGKQFAEAVLYNVLD